MGRPSVVAILSVVFVLYIGHSIWTLYTLFHPTLCHEQTQVRCLHPAVSEDTGDWPPVQLRVYASTHQNSAHFGSLVHRFPLLHLDKGIEELVQLKLPIKTRKNGTLWTHSFLLPADYEGSDPLMASWNLVQSAQITTYAVPTAETFQLMGAEAANSNDTQSTVSRQEMRQKGTVVSHLRSVLPLAGVSDVLSFEWREIPGEIAQLMRLDSKQQYRPIFYLDELIFRVKDLAKIDPQQEQINFTITYRPVSVGKLRLLITAVHSLSQLRMMGFSEKDVDEVKGIFTDTNFYFLALVVAVSALHILLDILAFKNDIHFWRGRKTMVGLSTRTLLWRCFSQSIIFLYLLDEETSLLVLIPAGIGALIELWKIKKAFKISCTIIGGIPRIRLGTPNAEEVQTEAFDAQGMKYLAGLLLPLCLVGAVYSLVYVPHKSWYSWFIQCMANGVYAFGFLFMLPQLFVNYKLKSVAHLPWRAFMYKAFNTFIDDLFAFVITMPTAHRVACFRDDLVFLVYLYQRYLYPVDKTRINEFGESFQPDQEKKEQ